MVFTTRRYSICILDANDVVLFAISLRLQAHYRELPLERRREKLWKQKRIIYRAVAWPPKMRVYRHAWVTARGGRGRGKLAYMLWFNRLFPSSPGPLYQNEVRCSTFDMEMIFHSHANKTHFHKKGWAPNLVLIQRLGETRKWPVLYPWFKCYFLLCFVFGYDNVW